MSDAWVPALALALAFALDRAVGEPRNAWHPVAWLGHCITWLGARLPMQPPRRAGAVGALAWAFIVLSVAALAWALAAGVALMPVWVSVPLLALALKPSFAWRMLRDEVQAVEAALQVSLPAGRERVARLCSRDTSTLTAVEVRETALETLAENFNDSLVAPLFWFAVAGLPGAWAWRAINTLDACWGYRGHWEWAGKAAARADDVAAWLPARLAAFLIRPGRPWSLLAAEARRTPSPNSGWPMAALALHLGVRLGKPGTYVLNPAGRPASGVDVGVALALMQQAAWVAVGLAMAALWFAGWLR